MKKLTLDDMTQFITVTNEHTCYLLVAFPTGGLYVDKSGTAFWNTGYGSITAGTLKTLKTIAAALKSTRRIGE